MNILWLAVGSIAVLVCLVVLMEWLTRNEPFTDDQYWTEDGTRPRRVGK